LFSLKATGGHGAVLVKQKSLPAGEGTNLIQHNLKEKKYLLQLSRNVPSQAVAFTPKLDYQSISWFNATLQSEKTQCTTQLLTQQVAMDQYRYDASTP